MEISTNYKLNECGRPELFTPPPYCRKAEQREDGIEAGESHSLKLTVSNPAKLLTLCKSLTDSSSKALEVKFNTYLMKEADCKCAFLLHLFPSFGEALVQTLGKNELETSLRYPIPEEVIKNLIKYENQALKCDEDFNPKLRAIFEKMFNSLAYKVIAVPILKNQQYYPCSLQSIQPIFLICFIDSTKHVDYIIKLSYELFQYCLPILLNTLAYEEETRQKIQYQSLLIVIKNLLGSLEDINGLMKTITEEARKITYAKKCKLFLNNSDQVYLISNVFKTFSRDKSLIKIENLKDDFIADRVATTRCLLNIHTDSEYSWMTKSLSEYTGFEANNLLCFPMKNNGNIIGAVQLCNKRSGHFSCFDEEITNLLGVFCGSLITHGIKYAERENYKLRNHLASQLMIYQIQVDEEEDVGNKVTCSLIHSYPDFELFSFLPRVIVQSETVCFVLKMFENLNFFKIFRVERSLFTRFVAYVKNGCRDVPYHNWMHLFSAAHFGYLCLKNLQLMEKKYITNLEALAYFVACFCHDVDYRGTKNPFEERANNVLATLYSSSESLMERHRLSQVLRILQTEGCNFLETFDRDTYSLFLSLLKDFVLATDLACHHKLYKKQYNMIKEGYNRNNPEHRYCFTSLMVTVADLSDFTKEWPAVREVSLCMFREYFTQSDAEKTDLRKIILPDLQIEFLKKICLPPFILLANLFNSTKEFVRIIKQHILYWEASKHIFEKAIVDGISCFRVLTTQGFDQNVEASVKILEETINNS